MFSKKLNKEELQHLRALQSLISQYMLVVNALELQKKLYTREVLLKKKGIEKDQEYNIDLKTGKITKIDRK